MTTNNKPLNLGNIGKGRSLKDALVVAFLAVLLGAFVAQISSTPGTSSASRPMAAATAAIATHG